jgi:SAM-dependent methyltransferase
MKPSLKRTVPWIIPLAGALVGGALLWRQAGRDQDQASWARRFYWFSYRFGFKPWDQGVPAPELMELVEGREAAEPGRALDLGCGTGTNCVYLAQHGWQVTGVDLEPRALAAAGARASAAGAEVDFVQGDVTRLDEAGVGDDFTLLLDMGCFHMIPHDRRDAYVAGVSAAAAPGATLLMFGATNSPFPAMRAGMTPGEVKERFLGWDLISASRVPEEQVKQRLAGHPLLTRAAVRLELWHYHLQRQPDQKEHKERDRSHRRAGPARRHHRPNPSRE